MKHLLAAATCLLLAAPGAQAQSTSSGGKAPDCAATQGPLPATWEGTAFAIDGDTLASVGLKPHIRIWGIQAPELRDHDKQESTAGMRARSTLESLLTPAGHQVSCRPTKYDRYCRVVAVCSVARPVDPLPPAAPDKLARIEIDLGLAMLNFGMAYGFYLDDALPWDPAASVGYAEAEDRARTQKRGLWPIWHGEK